MHAQQQQLINGAWVTGDADTFTKHDPVSGTLLWQGASASNAQVGAAIDAARVAFPEWARTTFAERQALVERFVDVLTARREELAVAIASETGKPLWEHVLKLARWSERWRCLSRLIMSALVSGKKRWVVRKPYCAIAPTVSWWSLALTTSPDLPNGHMVPALLAGNTACS